MPADLYNVLGVGRDVCETDLKKAYKKLALQHHPDKGGDPEEFKKIQEAHAVLSDSDKRRHYDMTGQVPGAAEEPGHGPGPGFPFGGFGGGGVPFDIGEIFGMFGAGGPGRRPGGPGPGQQVRRGKAQSKKAKKSHRKSKKSTRKAKKSHRKAKKSHRKSKKSHRKEKKSHRKEKKSRKSKKSRKQRGGMMDYDESMKGGIIGGDLLAKAGLHPSWESVAKGNMM